MKHEKYGELFLKPEKMVFPAVGPSVFWVRIECYYERLPVIKAIIDYDVNDDKTPTQKAEASLLQNIEELKEMIFIK